MHKKNITRPRRLVHDGRQVRGAGRTSRLVVHVTPIQRWRVLHEHHLVAHGMGGTVIFDAEQPAIVAVIAVEDELVVTFSLDAASALTSHRRSVYGARKPCGGSQ